LLRLLPVRSNLHRIVLLSTTACALWAPSSAAAQGVFVRADCDQSLTLDITDPIAILGYLFLGTREPTCLDACDANDSGSVDIADAIFTLSFLFLGGASPPPPHPFDAPDPTLDGLSCLNGRDPLEELRVTPSLLIFQRLGQSEALLVSAVTLEGATVQLGPVDGVRLSSENPAVATVVEPGIVTARGVGETRIVAEYRGSLDEAVVRVLAGADGSPMVKLSAPAPGSVVTGAAVQVAGVVSDPQAQLSIEVSGGPPAPLANNAGRFQGTAALSLGSNTVTVVAVGTMGTGRAAVTVHRAVAGSAEALGPDGKPLPIVPLPRVEAPDTTPPRLTITSPRLGAVVRSAVVDVEGTIDEPAAEVRVNGFLADRDGGGFRLRGLRLSLTDPRLVATAVDPAGNLAEVGVSLVLDLGRPRLTLTGPAGGRLAIAGSRHVAITGSVEPAGTPVSVLVEPEGLNVAASVAGTSFSASLDLADGLHDVVLTATLSASPPRRAQLARSLLVDTTPPAVEIVYPPPEALLSPGGFITRHAALLVLGRVYDPGVPLDLGERVTLRLGGGAPVDALASFALPVSLPAGVSDHELSFTDVRGNRGALVLRFDRRTLPAATLRAVSGDGQSVAAGAALPAPFVVEALDALGNPLAGRPLEFRVAAGSARFSDGSRRREVSTGVDGRAQAFIVAGREAGAASQVLEVTGPGFSDSRLAFHVHTTPAAQRVLVARGRRQLLGAAGAALPEDLRVRLLDGSGNAVAAVEVVFRVVTGNALVAGAVEARQFTSETGLASVEAVLPPGNSESVVEATSAGAQPLRFNLRGLAEGAIADTELRGAVVDERGQGVGGARVAVAGAAGVEAFTNAAGGFVLRGAPAGEVLLVATPGTEHAEASSRVVAVAGRVQLLVEPLRAARTADGPRSRAALVEPSAGAVLSLPALAGFRLEVAPGSARFPGGAPSGTLRAVLPNLRALGDPPADAARADVPLLLMPEGVRFDPPARLVMPNPGHAAGRELRLFAHAAASGGYLELAGGRATDDAATVVTPQASGSGAAVLGVRGGGLHYFAVPGPSGGLGGELVGKVEAFVPRLHEAPQRPGSRVFGKDVYAHSGEFFLEAVDLELPGRSPMGLHWRFRRRYESRHLFRGVLGWNWEHEYSDRRLLRGLAAGNIVRADGAGSFDEYLLDAATGAYVPPLAVFARLFVDAGGAFVERAPDGTRWRYFPLDGSVVEGRLESVSDARGDRLALVWGAGGRLDAVIDPLGRTITYAYDAQGLLDSVTDPAGRRVRFGHDPNGDLVSVTGPAVTGTPNGNDFPAGKTTAYVYSSGFADERLNHNLLQVISPREVSAGTRVPVLTNHYREDPAAPDADRVLAQDWGGTNSSGVAAGGRLTLEYAERPGLSDGPLLDADELAAFLLREAGVTRVTDREGNVSDLTWSGAGLPLSLRVHTRDGPRPREPRSLHPPPGVVPPWYETRWRWSVEGLLEESVSPRGGRVEYVYDVEAPLRSSRADPIQELHFPAPAADGAVPSPEQLAPEVVLRGFDPLFGRLLWEVPARAPAGSGLAYASLRFLDYQEGSRLEDLAAAAGVDPAVLGAALACAGVPLGLGDLNDDGATDQRAGEVVREVLPRVTLPDGTVQSGERRSSFNRFGQLVRRRDASGAVTRWEYYPESDPEGDGVPTPRGGLDPATGGYLRRVVVDPEGFGGRPPLSLTTELGYDRFGGLARRTDPRGNTVSLHHNSLGQLIEERLPLPLGYRRQRFWDADDRLARCRVENFTATESNLTLLVNTNPWIETDLDRDLLGQVVSVTREVSGGEVGAARSITTRLRYDREGRRSRRIQPLAGLDETWEYDERGLLFRHTRAAGTPQAAATTWHRDEDGSVVLEVDAADSDGDGQAEVTEQRHDGWGRLAAEIDAAGGTRVFEREPGGLVVSEASLGSPGGPTPRDRSGEGNVLLSRTGFEHDERGRLRRVERGLFGGSEAPSTLVESFVRDGEGRVLRRDGADGASGPATSFEYDGAGRVALEVDAAGTRTERVFDGNGNVVRELETARSQEPLAPQAAGDPAYDAEGRLLVMRSAVHVYDALDRRVASIDEDGRTWRARYDSRGNRIFISDATAPAIGLAADPELQPAAPLLTPRQRTAINGHGNRVLLAYDNLSRLASATHELRRDGSGSAQPETMNPYNIDGLVVERLEWDDASRLAAYSNDLGQRHAFELDPAGFVRVKTWPDGAVEVFERDRDGSVVEHRDQNGAVTTQRFDALNRVVERSVRPGAAALAGTTLQAFEYDGLSRLRVALDDNDPADPADDALVLRRHDSLGRLAEEWQGPFGYAWSWDGAGHRTSLQYPDGRRFLTGRGADGSLTELADESGLFALEYLRTSAGLLLEKRFPGGVGLSYLAADPGGIPRLQGRDAAGTVLSQVYTSLGGGTLLGFEYGRDPSGFPLYERRLHEDGVGHAWRYDSLYRVRLFVPNLFDPRVLPANPLEKLEFFTDGNHNWRLVEVDQSRRFLEVGSRSEYVLVDGEPLAYDRRGNLVRAGDRRFVYDGLDRLVRVERDGRLVVLNRYDAAGAEDPRTWRVRGRRVLKDVRIPAQGQPTGVTRFTYAEDLPGEERDAQGRLLRQYVYEDGGRPAVLLAHVLVAAPQARYFLHDGSGSSVGLTDALGALVERYRYGLHGEPGLTTGAGAFLNFSRQGNALYFGGLVWDFELRFHAAGARSFHPDLGRYLTDASALLPQGPLDLNGYVEPGLGPLPGEVAGGGSSLRRDRRLEPFRIRFPVDREGRFEAPADADVARELDTLP
jgi:YD repeat-containing protein